MSELLSAVEAARLRYHPLVLVVGPDCDSRRAELRSLAQAYGTRVLDVNLELSELLLPLSQRDRIAEVEPALRHLRDGAAGELSVFEGTEVLFEATLKHDPLRLLLGLSRSRPLVAAWSGEWNEQTLTYAVPGHPEYRRYRGVEAEVIAWPPGGGEGNL